jgi:hypothetical protein
MKALWLHPLATVPDDNVAFQLAAEVRNACRDETMPTSRVCDIESICKKSGFVVKQISLSDSGASYEALLIPKLNGNFEILVDPKVGLTNNSDENGLLSAVKLRRFRFRVAHEIGHSFFYDRTKKPPSRIFPLSKSEEHFCDQFASALLLPIDMLKTLPINAPTILALRNEFVVSAHVAAMALARYHPNCTIMALLWGKNPRDGIEDLRVVWRVGTRFVPLGARFPSHAVSLAKESETANLTEEIYTSWIKGKFHVSAARASTGNQIIVVLTPAIQSSFLDTH